jgi:hypothetical protein
VVTRVVGMRGLEGLGESVRGIRRLGDDVQGKGERGQRGREGKRGEKGVVIRGSGDGYLNVI